MKQFSRCLRLVVFVVTASLLPNLSGKAEVALVSYASASELGRATSPSTTDDSILSLTDFFLIPLSKGEFKVRGRITMLDDCQVSKDRCSAVASGIQADSSRREPITHLLRIQENKVGNTFPRSLWVVLTDNDLKKLNQRLGVNLAKDFSSSYNGLKSNPIEVYHNPQRGLKAMLNPISNEVTYFDAHAGKAISLDGRYSEREPGTTDVDLYVHKTTGAELWVAREGLPIKARQEIEREFVKKSSAEGKNANGAITTLPDEHLKQMQQAVKSYQKQHADRLAHIAAINKDEYVWTLTAVTIPDRSPQERLMARHQLIAWRFSNAGSTQ